MGHNEYLVKKWPKELDDCHLVQSFIYILWQDYIQYDDMLGYWSALCIQDLTINTCKKQKGAYIRTDDVVKIDASECYLSMALFFWCVPLKKVSLADGMSLDCTAGFVKTLCLCGQLDLVGSHVAKIHSIMQGHDCVDTASGHPLMLKQYHWVAEAMFLDGFSEQKQNDDWMFLPVGRRL